jgi:hypothetical protein
MKILLDKRENGCIMGTNFIEQTEDEHGFCKRPEYYRCIEDVNRLVIPLSYSSASHLGITPQALSWTIRNNRWKIERMKVVAKCLGVKLSSLMQ